MHPRPGGRLEEWESGWAELAKIIASSSGTFALLADARLARPPSALERAVVSKFLREQEAALSARCAGLAIAVSNPAVRAAAPAVFWLVKPPMSVVFRPDAGAARDWLDERFREVGAA